MQDSPSGTSSLAGRVLGHYRLVERIGAGGMGEVYRARDELLHRDVAVKVLPQGSLQDESARRRLRKEALALSRLNHSRIATVHDFDTQDGIDFLVMEFVPGAPVDTWAGSRQAECDVLALAIQLAEGLAAAHEQGVLHRDLKPANLRFTASGDLKILDFGLADLVAPLDTAATTMTVAGLGSFSGTLAYMAPEQLQGGRPDARTDIYAFGVVLYELATGRRPFTSPSSAALMGEIIYSVPPAPRAARPDLSAGIESIIIRCIDKDPARRYPAAADLLKDLRRCAAGTLPAARPVRATRAWRKPVVGAGALAVVLLVALSLWTTFRQPALAFERRDWLVIADFENLTGDAAFDKALDTALKVSIEQSSYVNVVPRRRIADALARMKKAGTPRIDGALAREVAQREGFRAVLTPVISGVGGAYALSATLENPATGASVKSAIVQAAKRDDVLSALDSLVRSVRRDLGESLSALSPQAKPLVKVTTSSLEALRQYSLAVEKHREAKFDEAKVFYENALRIDPTFTAAQASLGMMEFERFDAKRGKTLLAEAISHVDSLTERERYGIMAFHARAVENDLPKAVKHLESFVAMYPDQAATRNNLAVYYGQMGRFEEAAAAYREAIRVDPAFLLVRDGLAGIYLYSLGDTKAGIEVCRAELALNDRHHPAWSNLGWAYLGAGDLAQAQAAVEKALEVNPKSTVDWYRLGHIHRLRGEYPAAEQAFARVLEVDASEAAAEYELGALYRLMKREAEARERFGRFRAWAERAVKADPTAAEHYVELALANLRLGSTDRADALFRKARAMDPEAHFGQATFLSVQGRSGAAIDELEVAVQREFRNYIWLTIHTDLDNLRSEPRFRALLGRLIKK